MDDSKIFDVNFEKTVIDRMILEGELKYTLKDKGIYAHTDKGKISIEFNPDRFRPAEVPILFANTEKIQKLSAEIEYKLNDIIKDQLNYYLKKENRV
jgi:GDPmannose 4,6-dehydratase